MKITKKTKAVVPVHLFGLPCDMEPLLELAKRKNLYVVEDAAQAYGARYKGKVVGSFGDAGCLSFYPTKNLGGAGDGGMITTSSKTLADKLRKLRDHGQSKKYFHEMVGFNSRLDEIQAAVLLVKLKYIRLWNHQRRRHAKAYDRAFASSRMLAIPASPRGFTHVYHLYTVRTVRRDALAASLGRTGIGRGIYYPLCLHLQACYKSLGYRAGDFPVSERASREVLSLPLFPELSNIEREKVIDCVLALR